MNDQPAISNSLAQWLALAGGCLTRVDDGQEAIEAGMCKAPDIVLMNLGMPQRDGDETDRRLRNLLGTRRCVSSP